MAQLTNRLNAVWVDKVREAGRYPDGGGLYLVVTSAGTKQWMLRYRLHGKRRDHGLGGYPRVKLADARRKRDQAIALRQDDIDPVAHRRQARATARIHAGRTVDTFESVAQRCIQAKSPEWSNAKHGQQWANTMSTYVYPKLGRMPVQQVETRHVLDVLEPIWTVKPETASRVRQRIETVCDYAASMGMRTGENPARWKGNLQNLLASHKKIAVTVHHAALPYRRLPALYNHLTKLDSPSADALRFTILNAARTSEVLGMQWGEIDFRAKLWIIPDSRMKARREHRVPLTPEAIAILKKRLKLKESEYVFPGAKPLRPLSAMAMSMCLRGVESTPCTVHGFRSTFRDWCAEKTDYPREVAEAALAHVLGDATESAYFRSDLLKKRKLLMGDWAAFCCRERPEAD